MSLNHIDEPFKQLTLERIFFNLPDNLPKGLEKINFNFPNTVTNKGLDRIKIRFDDPDSIRVPNTPTNFVITTSPTEAYRGVYPTLNCEYSVAAPIDYAEIQVMRRYSSFATGTKEEQMQNGWSKYNSYIETYKPVQLDTLVSLTQSDAIAQATYGWRLIKLNMTTLLSIFNYSASNSAASMDPGCPSNATLGAYNLFTTLNPTNDQFFPNYNNSTTYFQFRIRFVNNEGLTNWVYSNVFNYYCAKLDNMPEISF